MKQKGFSLIEILIVIAIIAIITAIGAAVYINVLQRSRDAARMADLASLQQAILARTHSAVDLGNELCAGQTPPCEGSTYPYGGTSKSTDGTGWVKINFDSSNNVQVSALPVDPLNDMDHNFQYRSDGDHWKISTVLESPDHQETMQYDGGTDPTRYEIGSGMKQLN